MMATLSTSAGFQPPSAEVMLWWAILFAMAVLSVFAIVLAAYIMQDIRRDQKGSPND